MVDYNDKRAEIVSIRTAPDGYKFVVECPFCEREFSLRPEDEEVECDSCYTGDKYTVAVARSDLLEEEGDSEC